MLGFCLPPPAFLRQVDDAYEVNIVRSNLLPRLCGSYNSVIYKNKFTFCLEKCYLEGNGFICGNILTCSYITHLP
jgi:hypothetical protein